MIAPTGNEPTTGHVGQPLTYTFKVTNVGRQPDGPTVDFAFPDTSQGGNPSGDGAFCEERGFPHGAICTFTSQPIAPGDSRAMSATYFPTVSGAQAMRTSIGGETLTMSAQVSGPPRLTGLSVRPAHFKTGAGATVNYTLSEGATMTFKVLRAGRGRRLFGTFTDHYGLATANQLKWSGRVNGHALTPGSYELSARAQNSLGTGNSVTTRFTVT